MSHCTRRSVVLGLGAWTLSACGGETISTAEAPPGEGWLEVPLDSLPDLRSVGGVAELHRPEHLLHVWVLHPAPSQFSAVWTICTHGACSVVPQGERLV